MSLQIKDGLLMLYYCFDIANEIKLDKVEKVFGEKPKQSELVFERLTPKYIKHRTAPLLIRMGNFSAEKMQFSVDAKLYDFGVITIRFISKLTSDLDVLKKISSKIANSEELPKEAKRILEKIKKEIEPAVEKHIIEVEEFFEDYIIFKANEFDKKIKSEELLKNYSDEIAQALRCDSGSLSNQELKNAVKNPLSYYDDDLVIVDWNSAFVYDREHSYDVIDVIEYALIESLELRTYDTVLDTAIEKAYADLLTKKKFGLSPFSSKLDYLSTIKLEISDIIEKISNFMKLVGDDYLAKVYSTASERFYLDKWRSSVERKLDTVESTYSTLSGRLSNRRLLFVEVLMTILFFVWFITDIAILFLGK